jgi:hypothetical protein
MRGFLLVLTLFVLTVAVGCAQGNVGLGVILGEPTGLSLKIWPEHSAAFDLAAGWSLDGDEWFYLHGDFLIHNYRLEKEIEEEIEGDLPFYYGIGARALLREDHDSRIGIRIPLGLDYRFADRKFDVFVEIAPILDLLPETEFSLSGGIGVRYFF